MTPTARAHRHFDRIDDSREISQISAFVIKNNVETNTDLIIRRKKKIMEAALEKFAEASRVLTQELLRRNMDTERKLLELYEEVRALKDGSPFETPVKRHVSESPPVKAPTTRDKNDDRRMRGWKRANRDHDEWLCDDRETQRARSLSPASELREAKAIVAAGGTHPVSTFDDPDFPPPQEVRGEGPP